MQRYPLFLPRLRMMDPQMALVLLRECYLPAATHLIRMVEPAHTVPHAQRLDVQVHATYRAITGDEITAQVAGSKLNQLERARTMSASTSGSSSVFTCIPADQCLVMPPRVLRFVAQYRAGTHQMVNPMGVCNEELSTVHVLSCKKMRGIFVRHDFSRDVLKKICSQAGVVASIEVIVVEGTSAEDGLFVGIVGIVGIVRMSGGLYLVSEFRPTTAQP